MYNLVIPIRIVLIRLDEKTWNMCCFLGKEIVPYYQTQISEKQRQKSSILRKIAAEKLYVTYEIAFVTG